MNYSAHYNENLQGSNDPLDPNGIGGFAIGHGASDQTFNDSFDNFANSKRSQHKHNPSMASIDSVFSQSENSPQQMYNIGRPSPIFHMHDKEESPRKASGDDNNNHENTPTWSELKTKAGKERKRLPLACIACRRKKIKCSGEKPACKHCLKARIPCVYKVTTRKAAPRTDYMAMLDKRLKRMEDRVIKVIPKEELPDPTTRSVLRPPLPGTAPKNDKDEVNTKRIADDAFASELNTWSRNRNPQAPLETGARSRPPRDVENKLLTQGMEALPPQHIQEHLVEVYFDCVYGQSYLLLHKPSFIRKLKSGSVPPVLLLSICALSARFSTHPQVSTEPAFLRGEKWATPARKIVEERHFEPNITILTCMVMLALHYFGTCEGGLSWSFGGQASRMAYALQLHKELDHDPLGLAQAERATASGKPAPQIPELSFTDREIRRRVMWSCYMMDTFNSSGTERPSFLNEEYMFIQLPIKEVNFQMELPGRTEDLEGHVPLPSTQTLATNTQAEAKENMGVSAYVVRSVVLWKRIVKYLNLGGKEKDSHQMWDPLSQFAGLQRQLTQLKASLPPSLAYNANNLAAHVTDRLANQFIFLHLTITQNSLFLHRFAIPTAPGTRRAYPRDTPKEFLAAAGGTAVEAASQISKLLADSTGHTLTVPFAGYCAYASATVHIWGIFSKNASLESSSRENLRHCYKYLNRMRRYWAMFHYMAESVKDTYRAFADAASRLARKQAKAQGNAGVSTDPFENLDPLSKGDADANNETEGDESQAKNDESKIRIFQYGDWFEKYPHGVSEKEWEQNHLPHRSDSVKGSEAIMSQQSELQSVEEFFASLSPPSKAEDAANRRKFVRKKGKSIHEDKSTKVSQQAGGDAGRSQSQSAQQSHSNTDTTQHRASQNLASNSLYPLSDRTFPNLDLANSEIDVPMSGISTGLQSGQGTSAFDGTSPSTAMLSNPGLDQQSYLFTPSSGSGSGAATSLSHQRTQSGAAAATSPFDYVSPASTSTLGASNATTNTNNQNPSGMSFNFNYTSAVPQLDRQMVFGGYGGTLSPSATNSSLNNINNIDFWSNPWDNIAGDVDVDVDTFSVSGFNDPSFGLNQGGGLAGLTSGPEDSRRSSGMPGFATSQMMLGRDGGGGSAMGGGPGIMGGGGIGTAFFMPFNIEPPSGSMFGIGGRGGGGGGGSGGGMGAGGDGSDGGGGAGMGLGGFDGFEGFDSMMDMGTFGFDDGDGLGSGQGGREDSR